MSLDGVQERGEGRIGLHRSIERPPSVLGGRRYRGTAEAKAAVLTEVAARSRERTGEDCHVMGLLHFGGQQRNARYAFLALEGLITPHMASEAVCGQLQPSPA